VCILAPSLSISLSITPLFVTRDGLRGISRKYSAPLSPWRSLRVGKGARVNLGAGCREKTCSAAGNTWQLSRSMPLVVVVQSQSYPPTLYHARLLPQAGHSAPMRKILNREARGGTGGLTLPFLEPSGDVCGQKLRARGRGTYE